MPSLVNDELVDMRELLLSRLKLSDQIHTTPMITVNCVVDNGNAT